MDDCHARYQHYADHTGHGKTILAENLPDTEELPSLQEGHPQKERVEKYAASFQKLADTFYGCLIGKII